MVQIATSSAVGHRLPDATLARTRLSIGQLTPASRLPYRTLGEARKCILRERIDGGHVQASAVLDDVFLKMRPNGSCRPIGVLRHGASASAVSKLERPFESPARQTIPSAFADIGVSVACEAADWRLVWRSVVRYIRWYNEARVDISFGSLNPLEYRESLGLTVPPSSGLLPHPRWVRIR